LAKKEENMTDMTPIERALYDAQAKEEAWGFAESILIPWVEATRPIGSEELTRDGGRASGGAAGI
jgi:hypothetical protein